MNKLEQFINKLYPVWILLMAVAIYLNAVKLKEYREQQAEYRKYYKIYHR